MNILCLVAHPDDETILCGGTLALLASRGASVHVACLTRGEGGELGEPPVADREHLGELREQEMVCAVGKLGGKSLTFLGYADPLAGPDDKLFAPEHDPMMLAGQIVSTIKQFEAEAVITHGSNGEYGHPAHSLMHQMTLIAVNSLHKETATSLLSPALYTFSAAFPDHPYPRLLNKDDPADLILDVSSMLDKKEVAALCHKSQNALFVRRRSQQAGRQLTVREALVTVESLHRVFESPGDELSRLLSET
ncbi:MAG TPA: PIG-L deacetylase family protein [Anaerolineales bacterium]|nr:PIG-L deacetylase family protein [Anaerolineales bacterium]